MENARPPYVLDFMAGVNNSERDDNRRALNVTLGKHICHDGNDLF